MQGRHCKIFIKLSVRGILIILICLLPASSLWSQEQKKTELKDTLIREPSINQSLLRSFGTDVFLIPSQDNYSGALPISLHESITNLPPSLSSPFQQQIDVVSPWKRELARQNELRTLKLILGAVQAGGTAYILYEHIKKYGFK